MIQEFQGRIPTIDPLAWVHPMATVIGDVNIAAESSIWPGATLRGDEEPIIIGPRTSIQDNCTLHTYGGFKATEVGAQVTVGHNVVLHGCRIGDNCLIGIGSVILDGVEIGEGSFVAAGTLIPPGKVFPPGSFILGSPGRLVRPVRDADQASIERGWKRYTELARTYRQQG